ncbi:MAG: UDP-N-acetylmuramate dehydrogenase [Bacteroidota bacterium]|jgi:UDP-N-acetylmuramate dehydrogenase
MPEIASNVSLRPYNSFGLSVRADRLIVISYPEDIRQLVMHGDLRNTQVLVLGGGSNILFTRDFNGTVLLNRIGGIQIVHEDADHVHLKAGAGVNWHEFVSHTVDHGWGGLENLSLIPGTVGAAPIQNIGAYGVELKDTFLELEAIDLQDGSLVNFSRTDCAFGYRDSIFKRSAKGRYLIVSVTFCLKKHPETNTRYGAIEQELSAMGISTPTIKDVSAAVIRIRKSKLPDPSVIGNAGSFFKNPEVPNAVFETLRNLYSDLPGYPAGAGSTKIAAGYLIEKSGWKGKTVGNVGMHERQALVLVNHGSATGEELLEHAKRVRSSVKEKFGVELEMEVNVV